MGAAALVTVMAATEAIVSPNQRSQLQEFLTRLIRDRVALIGLIVLSTIAVLSLGAPWITAKVFHTNPTDQSILDNFQPWLSPNHLLGSDELGRDVLARVLYAGRVSLLIGFAVALVQMSIGVPLGLLAGFHGGLVDDFINALLQTVRGIPSFFLLIALSVLFRPSPLGLAVILGILGWTGTCRQVRGMVLSLKSQEYVEAARAVGASDRRIIFRHISPNVSSIVLIIAGFDIAGAIIMESGLSFLGLGIQPPTPTWGNMLSSALDNVTRAPWLIAVPGTLITVTVLSIFLVTDGIRDALDPRLNKWVLSKAARR